MTAPRASGTLSAALGADGSAARPLAAALVALVVMLAASLLVQAPGAPVSREFATPIGALPLTGLLIAFVAMAAGGMLARSPRFLAIAVVPQAVVWITIVSALHLAPGGNVASPIARGAVPGHDALAFIVSLIATALGLVHHRAAARR